MTVDPEQSELQARVTAALARLHAGTPLEEKNIRAFEAAKHHARPLTINVSMLAREAECSRTTLYDRCSHLLRSITSPDASTFPNTETSDTGGEADLTASIAGLRAQLEAERAAHAQTRSERADARRELKDKSRQLRFVQAECHVLQQTVIELNTQKETLTKSRQTMIDRTRKLKPIPADGSSPVVPFGGRDQP